MLCGICRTVIERQLDLREPNGYEGPGHHQNFASLQESISLGCYVCIRTWSSLKAEDQLLVKSSGPDPEDEVGRSSDAEAESVTLATIWAFNPFTQAYRLKVDFRPNGYNQYYTNSTNVFLIQSTQVDKPMVFTKVTSDSTNSKETIRIAKTWIDNCRVNHPMCNTIVVGNWYPTRLLDCGLSQSLEGDCRLIATKDAEIGGPYMTLSHCWGSADCLKLTTTNYANMMESVPFSTLPQLYQDAVQVTRNLGIRYLWVDSLCIIQQGDELRDWTQEVTVMGKVYENSYCNISAASSPDSQHTMFCDRRPEYLNPAVVYLDTGGQAESYWMCPSDLWEQEVTFALINSRAWVLQERLLSPRVLYFGERQILWECNETNAAEVYAKGGLVVGVKRLNLESPLESWDKIMEAYSNARLSITGDKLAAFTGIAEMFERTVEDESVVGLWRGSLGSDLLWYSRNYQRREDRSLFRRATRPTEYLAPSWSWMAIDGATKFHRRTKKSDDKSLSYEVLDVKLEYATANKKGPVRSGWLRMRGALKQPTLVRRNEDLAFQLKQSDLEDNSSIISFDPPFPDSQWEDDPGALYCLPTEEPQEHNLVGMLALVLQVVDRDKGVFRRAGLAFWAADVPEDMFRECSDTTGEFPCEEFIDGQHVFTII